MTSFLSRYSTYIYAILRIVTGFLFAAHGSQKLFGYPASASGGGELSALMAVGGVIELVGGFLIMIGFFTGFAAFISSGTMAVAYFMFHQPKGALPIMNGGDAAVLYCFIFLYIASRGSGVWSVDSVFRGSSSSNGG